jgi:predicted Zn-dependent peptidase
MVFKGTPTRSAKDLAMALESVGGSLDAYTAREHTSYQARVLDEHMEIGAEVLNDLVFNPLLRESDLKLERKVVLEEINTVDDTPDDLVFELHNAMMWGDHPYGYSMLGTRESVTALTEKDLRALHDRAYHPENVIVVATGNVEHDEFVATLDRTGWASRPNGGTQRPTCSEPVPTAPTFQHVPREGAQTHIVFGGPALPHSDERRYAMSLIGMALGGGMSSRLFQRIREELGLAYSVYTFQSFHAETGTHGVYVGTAPETAAKAAEAIREELSLLAEKSLTEEELTAGKNQLKGQITLALESVTSRMYRAAGVELYDEEFRSLDQVLELIEEIDAKTVSELCSEYFDPDKQTVLSLGPKSAAN